MGRSLEIAAGRLEDLQVVKVELDQGYMTVRLAVKVRPWWWPLGTITYEVNCRGPFHMTQK